MKLCFLDIDGPVINTPLYYINPMVSLRRTHMNHSAIGWIAALVKFTGAEIVTNSSHNYHHVDNLDDRDLRSDLISHGIKPEWFHPEWRTRYPYPTHRNGAPRSAAIDEWMSLCGKPESWVAFDDAIDDFYKDHQENNLVHIDFDEGITFDSFKRAYQILEGKEFQKGKLIV